MGKRKHKDQYERLLHKIKKLKKDIKRRDKKDEREKSQINNEDELRYDAHSIRDEDTNYIETLRSTSYLPAQSMSPINPPARPSSELSLPATPCIPLQTSEVPTQAIGQQKTTATASAPDVPVRDTPEVSLPQGDETLLDNTLLEILGEDPTIIQQYGKEIQADLAKRLQYIATNGLTKETRKELCDRHLPPINCTLIDAPELNPEIIAAVSDATVKRDKGIQLKQKQLGRAISCVGEALSTLMSKEDKDTPVIKLLMDACRLLCDNQSLDSITRRNFILYNLKKDMKEQIQKTNIDKFLFGSELSETVKTAKSISKSGADLKLPMSYNKNFDPKHKQYKPHQYSGTQPKRNNLNWKAPPPSRRHQGSQKSREPASSKSQHASSSRTSHRASRHRYSNRR